MSLRFVRGRAGSGKTKFILDEVREKLMKEPDGPPIYLLVPDQMSFELEYELIKTDGLPGMIRAQVLSFPRLAWRVLQETGGIARYHITEVGMHMLLRKIIEEKKKEFSIYKNSADQTGFINQLQEIIREFKRYCVSTDSLAVLINDLKAKERTASEEMLCGKLTDLNIIMQQYENYLSTKYVDEDDYLRLLSEKIKQSNSLKNAEVYIDGFHSFTPQEMMVVKELIQHCKRVTIALTLDPSYGNEIPDELNLFYTTGKTNYEIYTLANELGIEIEPVIELKEVVRFNRASLRHLESVMAKDTSDPYEDNDGITLVSADNRKIEIEAVAREIIKKVRDEGYKWRDCVVLLRNHDLYHDLIETIFRDYEVPFYQDQKKSVLHHPLIELIRSALDIIKTNWSYESVFRALKTGLISSLEIDERKTVELIDKMENHVIAHGIKGAKQWSEYWRINDRGEYKRSYNSHEEFEATLNQLKDRMLSPLLRLSDEIRRKETVRDMAESLYMFLESIEIPQKLEKLRDNAEEVTAAREHEQVWSNLIEMLDQMVECMGDEKINFALFHKIIETGLESLKFSLIPPAIDQVLVACVEMSRFINRKCIFLIGVNEGVFPAYPKHTSIISEEERDAISERGILLAPGNLRRVLDEKFIAYMGLVSPSDFLWISYPMSNEEGESLKPSIFIRILKSIFPKLEVKLVKNEPEEEKDELDYITNPDKTLSFLSLQLQHWKNGRSIPIWWDVYNWFIKNKPADINTLIKGLFYNNVAKKLSADTSVSLYGKNLKASVTRLEKFHSCAFAHFISYGLGLKKREVFQLQSLDIGTLYHDALNKVSQHLSMNDLKWSDLTDETLNKITTQVIEELSPKIQKGILLSTDRYKYIHQRLQSVVRQSVLAIIEHLKLSKYNPIAHEMKFGVETELGTLKFPLQTGGYMELIGRIDRVDLASDEKRSLIRIIDYKSGAQDIDITKIFYGLSLQTLTYLDVVTTNSEKLLGYRADPGGVLYFHVHNPLVSGDRKTKEDQIKEEILKSYKMKGLLLADKESIQLMDTSLESGYSKIIPVGIKKDGTFYSNSSVIEPEQFTKLQKHIRDVINKAGNLIVDGVTDINPYRIKQYTPCRNCEYRAICQFEGDYRNLKTKTIPDI